VKSEFLQEAKQDKKAAMKDADAFLEELIRNASWRGTSFRQE
jgi:hypothetical protein